MFLMLGLGTFLPIYYGTVYKVIALDISDKDLTRMGARSLLLNGLTRLPWGIVLDKIGFRQCWFIISASMFVLGLFVYDLRDNLFSLSLATFAI